MKKFSEFINKESRLSESLIDLPVPEVVEGDYGTVYPVCEMAYDRKTLCDKLENTAYKVAEHLILLLSAISQNDDEELFEYWCKEIFSKYIAIQNDNHFKKNDSPSNRRKAIEHAYYELKDLKEYWRFERTCIRAFDREKDNANELSKKGIKRTPITITSDRKLYNKYLSGLEYIIQMFTDSSDTNKDEFIDTMRNIAE